MSLIYDLPFFFRQLAALHQKTCPLVRDGYKRGWFPDYNTIQRFNGRCAFLAYRWRADENPEAICESKTKQLLATSN